MTKLQVMDGRQLYGMLLSGFRNMAAHRAEINDLNVFPVPDGDTGTNMVLTMDSGLKAAEKTGSEELQVLCSAFARSVTLSARGNSGVILSQFLRGWLELLAESAPETADAERMAAGWNAGVKMSYDSVTQPVEGTMLTVLRESTETVLAKMDGSWNVFRAVEEFLAQARVSLEKTPDLLPVLKQADVVDSGGAGIVYLFEGFLKFFLGEEIPDHALPENISGIHVAADYAKFGRESTFSYGYCTELLIQLLDGREDYRPQEFRTHLEAMGESIVVSESGDKVKVHIHTANPERILSYCHRFGEFLNLKIENMSVQHTELGSGGHPSEPELKKCAPIAAVVVSPDDVMKEIFLAMGADAVILCDGNPSSKDYIDAFRTLDTETILVFPNHPNSVLSAKNAAQLYTDVPVYVIESRSVAQCYSVLPMLDFFSKDPASVVAEANDIAGHMVFASVSRASKDARFGADTIRKGDYIALRDKTLLASGESLPAVAVEAIRSVLRDTPMDVVTAFCGEGVSSEDLDEAFGQLHTEFMFLEIQTVHTANRTVDLLLSFE